MPAAKSDAADQIDQAEQGEAEHGCEQHGGEDLIGSLLSSRDVDHRAETLPTNKFADDRADYRESARDAQSGENLRQRRRETQLEESYRRGCSVQLEQIAQ